MDSSFIPNSVVHFILFFLIYIHIYSPSKMKNKNFSLFFFFERESLQCESTVLIVVSETRIDGCSSSVPSHHTHTSFFSVEQSNIHMFLSIFLDTSLFSKVWRTDCHINGRFFYSGIILEVMLKGH